MHVFQTLIKKIIKLYAHKSVWSLQIDCPSHMDYNSYMYEVNSSSCKINGHKWPKLDLFPTFVNISAYWKFIPIYSNLCSLRAAPCLSCIMILVCYMPISCRVFVTFSHTYCCLVVIDYICRSIVHVVHIILWCSKILWIL